MCLRVCLYRISLLILKVESVRVWAEKANRLKPTKQAYQREALDSTRDSATLHFSLKLIDY